MNLEDPKDLAAAFAPLMDAFETRLLAAIEETMQKGIDRLHGIKITTATEIDVPPRATE